MLRLFATVCAFFFAATASAQWIGGLDLQGVQPLPSPNWIFNSSGQLCSLGFDGTAQFCINSTAAAAEHWMAVAGIAGAGASLVAQGASANVAGNVTAQGNANVNLNSGSGALASAVDPGAPVSVNGQVQLTPSSGGGPAKVGNSTYGVKIDCGAAVACQIGPLPASAGGGGLYMCVDSAGHPYAKASCP